MGYQKETRRFKKALNICRTANDVWFVDRDARRILRPETYERFALELRHKKETLAQKDSYIPVRRGGRYFPH